ncbi:hypothetical protein GCM10020220_051110 [Nonomuraea rubra]
MKIKKKAKAKKEELADKNDRQYKRRGRKTDEIHKKTDLKKQTMQKRKKKELERNRSSMRVETKTKFRTV